VGEKKIRRGRRYCGKHKRGRKKNWQEEKERNHTMFWLEKGGRAASKGESLEFRGRGQLELIHKKGGSIHSGKKTNTSSKRAIITKGGV